MAYMGEYLQTSALDFGSINQEFGDGYSANGYGGTYVWSLIGGVPIVFIMQSSPNLNRFQFSLLTGGAAACYETITLGTVSYVSPQSNSANSWFINSPSGWSANSTLYGFNSYGFTTVGNGSGGYVSANFGSVPNVNIQNPADGRIVLLRSAIYNPTTQQMMITLSDQAQSNSVNSNYFSSMLFFPGNSSNTGKVGPIAYASTYANVVGSDYTQSWIYNLTTTQYTTPSTYFRVGLLH